MVQITNAVLIATAIVPALAAPIMKGQTNRPPPRVFSASSVRPREVLETREPRITSSQVNSIAKGASQIAHHLKNGIEFGVTWAS